MMKYFYLLISFFKASLMSDIEYRFNLLVKILTDIVWYIAQIAIFEVLFRNAPQLSGWNLQSIRVFMGILFIIDALWMIFFSENLERLSDKVRKGDLDLLLTKPINSQFMMSCQRMNTPYVGNLIMTVSFLLWSINQLPTPPTLAKQLLLFLVIPSGLIICYGFRFFFSASALIFTKSEHINYLWYNFYRLATRPDALYPPWLRYFILTAFPMAFVASVPAQLILNQMDWVLFSGSIGFPLLLIYSSNKFWNFALRFYASASS